VDAEIQRDNVTRRQAESSPDLLFKDAAALKPLDDHIIKTARHTVTPDHRSRFPGKRSRVLMIEAMSNDKEEQNILFTVAGGEFSIKGMTNKLLRKALSKTLNSQWHHFVLKKEGNWRGSIYSYRLHPRVAYHLAPVSALPGILPLLLSDIPSLNFLVLKNEGFCENVPMRWRFHFLARSVALESRQGQRFREQTFIFKNKPNQFHPPIKHTMSIDKISRTYS
jgi:hypothetical protein